MAIWLAAAANSWRGKQDASLQHDQMLALLDVGQTPTHLAMKPDGGEVFATNFGSDSISEISTWTNEVLGTYVIGAKPSRAIISRDDSTLWATNFGADSASMYSIDDGRMEAGVRTGSRPDALAFSADEHLLLIVDAGSSDVAVFRTQSKDGPSLVTMLPAGDKPNDIVVKSFRSRH
jgi:YVTN family beta-propeller protein